MTDRPLRFVEHVAAAMDTAVSIQIAEASASPVSDAALIERAKGAFRWFEEVESVCSRFDAASELSRVNRAAREAARPVEVSPLLFEVVQVALAVAMASDGAFDPTMGDALLAAGFDRHWRTGETVRAVQADGPPSGQWRDVVLDADRRTVTFMRPITLDLGGIAKGFAIDLAAQELADLPDIAINAGGDVYVRGLNPNGRPWRIGIRDPQQADRLVARVDVSNAAVCTSGIDQRRRADGQHHLLDPRTGRSAMTAASMTVLAPLAVMADALATAAFVLGPREGLGLLEREQLQGLCIDRTGAVVTTETSPFGTWRLLSEDTPTNAVPCALHVPR